jgi:hypothetical protein
MTDMSANCTGGTYPDYKTHVAIHELGHALGLGHSDPVTSDVIYSIVNTTHHQLNLTAGDKSDYNFLWDIAFRPESVQSWSEVDFDNYRFFNYELFFCFITILLQMKKYPEAAYFIHSKYFYRNTTGELRQSGFEIFNRHVRSLDEFRNNRLGLRRVSVTADLIKARATHKDVHFEDSRQTDLLLHYVSQLRGERFQWFPRTSVYGGRGSGIEIFERMISERHFQKIKALLDVDTVDELKTLIAQCVARSNADQRSYSGLWDYDVRPIENVIDVQSIATIR